MRDGPCLAAVTLGAPVARRCAKSKELRMTDAIAPDVFQVLIDRTGLKLTAKQFDELRAAYPKLKALTAKLKTSRDVSAEPASVFSPKV
jgi:hypothetical protein